MSRFIELKDKDPLMIDADAVKDGAVYVCRCGLSADWPYCDSSHAQARKEAAGKRYVYHRAAPGAELQREEAPADLPAADPRPTAP